jgi:predicted nuclease with TOPRIM domain
MNWGSIAEIITTLLFGGGLLTFVTIKDKKTAAILENMQKVIDELRDLANSYKEEIKMLKAEIAELKNGSKNQEEYIQDLHKQNSDLYEKLDKANSRAAVNKLLKCQNIGCDVRRPPLGEGATETFKQIRNGNLGEENV